MVVLFICLDLLRDGFSCKGLDEAGDDFIGLHVVHATFVRYEV